MKNILKKMKETRELIAVYYKSTSGTYTGFVRELDDEFILFELISPSGRADGFTLVREQRLTYTVSLNKEETLALFKMTPYAYRTSDIGRERVNALTSLDTEIDFHILVYKKI